MRAFVLLLVVPLFGSDPYCPAYPKAERSADEARVLAERAYSLAGVSKRPAAGRAEVPASINFIDDHIFGKISADRVPFAETVVISLAPDAPYISILVDGTLSNVNTKPAEDPIP